MVHMLQTTQHLKAQNTDDSIFSSTKNVSITGLACQSFCPWRHSCIMCIVIGTSTSVEFLNSASFFWPILTSLGSHCHTSKTGCLKASTVPCERWYYTSPTDTSNRHRREETSGEKRGERQNRHRRTPERALLRSAFLPLIGILSTGLWSALSSSAL